jgi:hypothetical protein
MLAERLQPREFRGAGFELTLAINQGEPASSGLRRLAGSAVREQPGRGEGSRERLPLTLGAGGANGARDGPAQR